MDLRQKDLFDSIMESILRHNLRLTPTERVRRAATGERLAWWAFRCGRISREQMERGAVCYRPDGKLWVRE